MKRRTTAIIVLALLGAGCGSGDGATAAGDTGSDGDTDAVASPEATTGDANDPEGDLSGEVEAGPTVPWEPPPAAEPYVDRPYLQEYNHTTNTVDPAIGGLVGVVRLPAAWPDRDAPAQVTSRALVVADEAGAPAFVEIPAGDPELVAAASSSSAVVLAGPGALYRPEPGDAALEAIAAPEAGAITGLVGGDSAVWVLGDQGFARVGAEGAPTFFADAPPTTAAAERDGTLFLGGDSAVGAWALPAGDTLGEPLWTLSIPEIGPVRALVADVALPEALDLVVFGDDGAVAVDLEPAPHTLDLPELASDRVPFAGGRGAVATSDGGFLVYGTSGAFRAMDRGDGFEWRVYPAERWLPSEDVRGVVTTPEVPDSPIYLATSAGLATVAARRITLAEKLEPFVERIVLRHDRDGAVADSHLTTRGDLSSNIPWDSDNDGGWTCYWILAECYRWKVTGDPEARAHFDKSLAAMLALRTLTGTDHFVARAVIRKEGCQLDDCDDPDDGEWFTSPDGAWWVKGDTSNDEVISHMFMMGPAYDHCADEAQREGIRDHVRGIVGGLMDHGWQLLDLDGEVTTYGQFDPGYCNGIEGMYADGGRRSLAMLANLTLAYYLTGEQRFLDGKRELMEEHHYDENAVHESEYPFRSGRWSGDGDELSTQSWVPLLRYETDPALRERWLDGWQRTYGNTRLQQAAWWDVANAVLTGEPEPGFANAARWLRLAPVDMIRWNIHNSHRRDLAAPPAFYDQVGRMRSDGRIIPYDERACDRWNTSQFKVDGGHGGWREMDGADVLAPYWMARYYGMIVPE